MTDIVMVRALSISADPRVSKFMFSLSKKYKVLALGWDRELSDPSVIHNEKLVVKQLRLKCSYNYFVVLLLLPVFWLWVIVNLFIHKPKYICAFDFNVLVACYFYRIIYRHSSLVFDVGDRFSMYVPEKYGPVHYLVDLYEESMANLSDAVTVASTLLLNTFHRWRQKNYAIILNSPADIGKTLMVNKNQDYSGCLTLVYTGMIWERRGLMDLVNALDGLNNIKLKMAGRVIDQQLLEYMLKKPYVAYLGLLPYKESIALEATGDVMIAFYDPVEPITEIAMPNKAFEAMMLGIPLLTNVFHIIKSVNCGIAVEYGDVGAIRSAVIFLRDNPSERYRLGQAGRLRFENEYDWSIMEKKLFGLFESQSSPRGHAN